MDIPRYNHTRLSFDNSAADKQEGAEREPKTRNMSKLRQQLDPEEVGLEVTIIDFTTRKTTETAVNGR